MVKDYYLILGVPLDAGPGEIRSAFRERARRYHPDRRGAADAEAFQDVSEAYGVLSDPVERARYDQALRPGAGLRGGTSGRPPSREPEPLISEPVPLARWPETVRPSYDALLDRLRRNFEDLAAPKAERSEPLNFELILSPREARHGVMVPIRIPVFSTCRSCEGLGRAALFSCTACDGEGRIIDDDTVEIRVPAGVRDGATLEVSLESLGIHNLWLRVFLRIEAH